MKRKTKKSLILSLSLLFAAFSVGASYALYQKGDATPITFNIAGEDAVTYALYKNGTEVGSFTRDGTSYIYDGYGTDASESNLFLTTDTFSVYKDGTALDITYTPSVEGHYNAFAFDGSTLSATMLDKAVYLKQLNDNRLWDDYWCYAWDNDDSSVYNASYPGVKMAVVTSNVLTKAYIPPTADRVIFSYSGIGSEGTLTSTDCVKTSDLTYSDSAPYFQMSDHNNVVATAAESISVTPTYDGNSGLFLAGSFQNWTGGDSEFLLEQTQAQSDSCDQYVVKPKASDGDSFKLVSGSVGGSSFAWYGTTYVRVWLDAPSWWANDSAVSTIGMWGNNASYVTAAMTSYTPSFSTSDLWYYYDIDTSVYTGIKFYRNVSGAEYNSTGNLSVPSSGSYNVYNQSSSSWTNNSVLGDSAVKVPAGTLLSASGSFNLALPSDNPHLLFKKASSGYYIYYL